MTHPARTLFWILFLAGAAYLGFTLYQKAQETPAQTQPARGGGGPPRAIPVEVAEVSTRSIELRRTYSGALEATAEIVVSPKVGGRVQTISVDLSDPVARGQIVAELDDDEFLQEVAKAEAELAVANANLVEAENATTIAGRQLSRLKTLLARGVASESQADESQAEFLAAQSRVAVAKAQIARAEAALASARIRLGYTQVKASWTGGADMRVVAERFVDTGETVSANTKLLSIVELDPITAVIYVPETDYGRLSTGQRVAIITAAHPDETFAGTIARISPVFQQATRQARVELTLANRGSKLKPGMFVRAEIVLARREAATVIPEQALTRRDDTEGVFLLSPDGATVSWRPVSPGIHDGGWVELTGETLAGKVVTLGQQLINDGASVVVRGEGSGAGSTP